ncbi:MAG: HEAT repeat domain-containing protein [Elusimicrobia bacterium]|nr:HEAT repeat domain-containing protein [Elusimicrobiota bacterium]
MAELATTYISSISQEEKLAIIEQLRRTAPSTGDDLRNLLNLYTRFPEAQLAAEQSLLLLSPQAQQFGPYFLGLIQDEDPFLRMFGLSGAYHLRYEAAVPAIRKLAEAKFAHSRPTAELLPGEANAWQSQYAAVRILALWEGKSALPLLLKKVKEAPPIAALIAENFWEQSLDRILSWSKSKRPDETEMARSAWGANVPAEAVLKTWPKLRALMLDKGKPVDLRHRAALKLGLAARDPEAQELLKEREARKKDDNTRLLLDTALFASRSPRAIPLLEEYVKTNPSAVSRAGALVQLKEMLPKERYRELLRWVAQNDSDQENRANAKRELSEQKN